jgi:oligoendopeptidase F
MSQNNIPDRKDIPSADKWDLTTLYISDNEWETALSSIIPIAKEIVTFKGCLGESSGKLLAALKLAEQLWKTAELTGNYAGLRKTEDEGNSKAQEREGRYTMTASRAESLVSFLDAEILAIPDEKMNAWLQLPEFADYRIYMQKLLHMKPYKLSEKEERILALQTESAQTAYQTFSVLSNVDFNFGAVTVNGRELPLTQTTWSQFMENPDRSVREKAYRQFYTTFESFQHTLASLYAGSVAQDVFEMRARGYKSSLQKALYKDKVPESVYHNLIETVHANLPVLHRFYVLRRKILGLRELRHWDVYVPLVKNVDTKTSYDESVEICRKALAPLGREYTDTLCTGLKNGWVDRYENKGKRSGAFSSGAYTGYPYILMNYKDTVIRDVFTMAHEGGHSMHTWYSARNNPFMQYNYTIFEAEVASTFNEELVFQYLLDQAAAADMKTYLLAMRAGDILATLYRQTMFAEYELQAHELVEQGTPLSADVLRDIYGKLLIRYFGPEMHFEPNSNMEGLRIPHFYGAFYVYKYATGISAALALADRVLKGGKREQEDYFTFLKSGGSKYPIDSLKAAGVDMEKQEPVQAALDRFAQLVTELENTLKITTKNTDTDK